MRSEQDILMLRARQLVAGWGSRAEQAAAQRLRDAERQGDDAAALRWAEVSRMVRDILWNRGAHA
ncbi:MAG TPA: hypothetical protein VEB20_09580 [Azospirillaceae bacterium]|nr:hypothetical protein [Azospirillaceae bacterium]